MVGIVSELEMEMYSLLGPPLIITMSTRELPKRRMGRESTWAVIRPLLSTPTVIFASLLSPVIVTTPWLRVMFELLEPEPPEPGVIGGGLGLGVPEIGGGVTGAPPLIFSTLVNEFLPSAPSPVSLPLAPSSVSLP